ncbi:MAG: DUF167 domain-containing protein [Thermoplasmata archaeon]
MGQVAIWARPGGSEDRIRWDPWRRRWVVSCRAAAIGGEANAAIRRLLAGWLELPEARISWAHAGRTSAKQLRVEGIDDAEIGRRLARASGASGPATDSPR